MELVRFDPADYAVHDASGETAATDPQEVGSRWTDQRVPGCGVNYQIRPDGPVSEVLQGTYRGMGRSVRTSLRQG